MGSHRKPADGENTRRFLEPKLDPFLAVDRGFAQQESASDATRDYGDTLANLEYWASEALITGIEGNAVLLSKAAPQGPG